MRRRHRSRAHGRCPIAALPAECPGWRICTRLPYKPWMMGLPRVLPVYARRLMPGITRGRGQWRQDLCSVDGLKWFRRQWCSVASPHWCGSVFTHYHPDSIWEWCAPSKKASGYSLWWWKKIVCLQPRWLTKSGKLRHIPYRSQTALLSQLAALSAFFDKMVAYSSPCSWCTSSTLPRILYVQSCASWTISSHGLKK